MKTISFKTHVGENGILQVTLPPEIKNMDLEVTLVFQPISDNNLLEINNLNQLLSTPRKAGYWKGKVKMADDFDILPDDIINSFEGE
jgi:hypothetical protein